MRKRVEPPRLCEKCGKKHYAKGLCKACYGAKRRPVERAYNKKYFHDWYMKNRERQIKIGTAARRLRDYGLTQVAFNQLLEAQGGACAICRVLLDLGRGTHVDHDHGSGLVRGILCGRCNRGIGVFKDDAALLRAAATYLCEKG